MVDWEILKKLIQLAKEEEVTGLTVEEKGVKYEVRRDQDALLLPHSSHVATHNPVPSAPTPAQAETTDEEDGVVAITSPMVGTFYRSPSPEAPPFVESGDEVEVGKVVCIIEAMKLFNEIESDVRGKIIKVLAENGKPVEYGQKLFLVKKA
jgi:acetyl-CoA carboxylase biotin carboxyl carrier protein